MFEHVGTLYCNHTCAGSRRLAYGRSHVQASVNLATRQARVVIVANGHETPTALTRAAEAAGFPARKLWDTIREDTRMVLDVQGLKVSHKVNKNGRWHADFVRSSSCAHPDASLFQASGKNEVPALSTSSSLLASQDCFE